MDTLMSAEEVRGVLRVSRRTFESMVAQQKVPCFILVGRQRRWRRKDLEEWISSLAEAATAARHGHGADEREAAK